MGYESAKNLHEVLSEMLYPASYYGAMSILELRCDRAFTSHEAANLSTGLSHLGVTSIEWIGTDFKNKVPQTLSILASDPHGCGMELSMRYMYFSSTGVTRRLVAVDGEIIKLV